MRLLNQFYAYPKAGMTAPVFQGSGNSPSPTTESIYTRFAEKNLTWRTVAPGLQHAQGVHPCPDGLLQNINILRVDPKQRDLRLILAPTLNTMIPLTQTPGAIATVNNGFFRRLPQYRNYLFGPVILNGQILVSARSPRVALCQMNDGQLEIRRVPASGRMRVNGQALDVGKNTLPVSRIQTRVPYEIFHKYEHDQALEDKALARWYPEDQKLFWDESVLFDRSWGTQAPVLEPGMIQAKIEGKRVTAILDGDAPSSASARFDIPKDGTILVGPKDKLAHIRLGDFVSDIVWDTPRDISTTLGNGQMLVQNGKNMVATNQDLAAEMNRDFLPFSPGSRRSGTHLARTLMGINNQEQLLLVTIDGPNTPEPDHIQTVKAEHQFVGLTRSEAAELMKSLGAVNAMSSDGGQSTQMAIGADGLKVVSKPTFNVARNIPSGLGVFFGATSGRAKRFSPASPKPTAAVSNNNQALRFGLNSKFKKASLPLANLYPAQRSLKDPTLHKAGCGLVAALAFMNTQGRSGTLEQIRDLAKKYDLWNEESGMRPPQREPFRDVAVGGMNWGEPMARLLKYLNLPIEWGPGLNWDKIRQSVTDPEMPRPVIFRAGEHYWVADDYNAQDGTFHLGESAKALPRAHVPEWVTPEEFERKVFIPGEENHSYFLRKPQGSDEPYRPSIVYQFKDAATGKPSPFSDDRMTPTGMTRYPAIFVIHETLGSYENAVANFSGKRAKGVSTHALIDRDGEIRFFVPPNQSAWASGESEYGHGDSVEREMRDATRNGQPTYTVNKFAVQVELVSPQSGRYSNPALGIKPSHEGYTEAQYKSLAWLLALTDIPMERVTYHKEVDATPKAKTTENPGWPEGQRKKWFCPRDFDEDNLKKLYGQIAAQMPEREPFNILEVPSWKELVAMANQKTKI